MTGPAAIVATSEALAGGTDPKRPYAKQAGHPRALGPIRWSAICGSVRSAIGLDRG